MRTHKWIASVVTGSVVLAGPLTSFAAGPVKEAAADTAVSEEEILDAIQDAPAAMSVDGRGGGGIGYFPPVYGGGVQIDVSVTKEVTPDFVALNAYCNSGKQNSREAVRTVLDQMYQDIRAAVGTDGRVRKNGAVNAYPFYGPTGEESGSFTGDMSVMIRLTNVSAAQRISDAVENEGCGANWDVRLLNAESFELSVLDDLSSRLEKRKSVFEKLLKRDLNTIVGAMLNTWVDGYASYDASTNKADATTTLSVSYELEEAQAAPARSSTRRTTNTAPRG